MSPGCIRAGLAFVLLVFSLSACDRGQDGPGFLQRIGDRVFGGPGAVEAAEFGLNVVNPTAGIPPPPRNLAEDPAPRKRWFSRRMPPPEESIRVNPYLWSASLQTLSFLPLVSADPATGVITTGFGVAPGGSRAYRAEVWVTDDRLDAASLFVRLYTRAGPAARETQAALEDAILTRARQLRLADR